MTAVCQEVLTFTEGLFLAHPEVILEGQPWSRHEGFSGGVDLDDPVGPEDPEIVSEPTVGQDGPASGETDQAQRLDFPFSLLPSGNSIVGDCDDPPVIDRPEEEGEGTGCYRGGDNNDAVPYLDDTLNCLWGQDRLKFGHRRLEPVFQRRVKKGGKKARPHRQHLGLGRIEGQGPKLAGGGKPVTVPGRPDHGESGLLKRAKIPVDGPEADRELRRQCLGPQPPPGRKQKRDAEKTFQTGHDFLLQIQRRTRFL